MSDILKTSPWGRKGLSEKDKAEIEAGPTLTHIGFSRGWSCRLYAEWGTSPLVEVFRQPSAIGAYRAALALLPEFADWRGCAVEVAS